ncbi:hypothetical protein GTS46_001248 [Salmonella enterica]|nr:hypothetical protein [Salmonella enterica]
MTTITRERLEWLSKISGRDDMDDINGDEIRELARIALASLSAEPVRLYRERNPYNGMTTGWQELTQQEYEFVKDNASENAEFRTVYTAPPAPAVPEEMYWQDAPVEGSTRAAAYATGWNACRAAMLQGGAE